MEKIHAQPFSIDEYIATFPKDVQLILEELRQTIRKAAPEAKETIKYGIPTYSLNGNLVHFGGYKNHIGFYPTPSGITAFKNELEKYETGKGTLQFPINKPLPLDLIRQVVEFRVMMDSEKKKKK